MNIAAFTGAFASPSTTEALCAASRARLSHDERLKDA
jgi:hypothetical protein